MSGGGERRIAVIVALDAVGYSRQSEIDEQRAVAAVSALRERIEAGAAAHGGRLFNSAGDGFMLEFASASGALAFAEELMSSARVPLRAGVHVGEVSAMPNGDLLGHGVNVAARLQAMAASGELLASEDVKHALSPAKRVQLEPHGAVQFDKMQERLAVMRLAPAWRPKGSARRWIGALSGFVQRRRLASAIGGALLLGVAALAFYFSTRPPAIPANIVAVLPFDGLYNDADAQFYAEGVAASVASAVTSAGVPTVSPTVSFHYRGPNKARAATELGVLFVIDGDVREELGRLRVSWHMDDARTGATVLTQTYDAPRNDAGALSERVATSVAASIGGWFFGRSPEWRFLPDIAHVGQLFQSDDASAPYEAARHVADEAPNSPMAQSLLAFSASKAMAFAPLAQRAPMVAIGRTATARALQIDPHFAEAYVARSQLVPGFNWAEREATLRQAIAGDPAAIDAPRYLGELLYQAGRAREAENFSAAALERDPNASDKMDQQFKMLMALQRWVEASTLLQRMMRLWPADEEVAFDRYSFALFGPDPSAALRLVTEPEIAALNSGDGVQPLDRLARAYVSHGAGDIAASERGCRDPRARPGFRSRVCMLVLASVGRLDEAFAIANSRYDDLRGATPGLREQRWLETAGNVHDTSPLFFPQAARMRADARFADIVARQGLLDYWRTAGAPDFCTLERAPVCQGLLRRALP